MGHGQQGSEFCPKGSASPMAASASRRTSTEASKSQEPAGSSRSPGSIRRESPSGQFWHSGSCQKPNSVWIGVSGPPGSRSCKIQAPQVRESHHQHVGSVGRYLVGTRFPRFSPATGLGVGLGNWRSVSPREINFLTDTSHQVSTGKAFTGT